MPPTSVCVQSPARSAPPGSRRRRASGTGEDRRCRRRWGLQCAEPPRRRRRPSQTPHGTRLLHPGRFLVRYGAQNENAFPGGDEMFMAARRSRRCTSAGARAGRNSVEAEPSGSAPPGSHRRVQMLLDNIAICPLASSTHHHCHNGESCVLAAAAGLKYDDDAKDSDWRPQHGCVRRDGDRRHCPEKRMRLRCPVTGLLQVGRLTSGDHSPEHYQCGRRGLISLSSTAASNC